MWCTVPSSRPSFPGGGPSPQRSQSWALFLDRSILDSKPRGKMLSRRSPMTNGEPIISIRDLRKTYHVGEVDVHALRGVDLDVQPSEFVSIVGPSGSGKSTLFHIVGGLTPPTSGTIHIAGRDLLGMSDSERTELRKTTVGFVFQKYNLLPTLPARKNIEIARDIAHKNGPRDAQFLDILKLLGIENRLDHKPRALSGGEQQ